jgi:CheY-like chemotaxis protein
LLGGTETILVAEDEEVLRNLARDVLEGLDYTVLLAENGEEAVKMYEQNPKQIDLLLLDVVMPRMGGWEASERIRVFLPKPTKTYIPGLTQLSPVRLEAGPTVEQSLSYQ